MNDKERISRFFQALEIPSEEQSLSPEDRANLEAVRRLQKVDFSAGSSYKRKLGLRLAEEAPGVYQRHERRGRMFNRVGNVWKAVLMAGAMIGFALVIIWTLDKTRVGVVDLALTPSASQPAIAVRSTESEPPTGTITPGPTLTPTDQLMQSFCDLLKERYQPPEGFKTYCDADYGFAFDYPITWRITHVSGSSDAPGTSTQLVRRAQRFEEHDMSNYIRVDTYRMAVGSTLAQQVERFWSYPFREIPDQPYDVRIGGMPAAAILNRWQQDYSAVYLFFQHGDYYSIMELKAISHAGLDTNWQIAASIQIPGAFPLDNEIPDDLIEDSYTLLEDQPPDLLYISMEGKVIIQPFTKEASQIASLPDDARILDAVEMDGNLFILRESDILEVNLETGASRPFVLLDPPGEFGALLPLGKSSLVYSVSINAWDQAGIGIVDIDSRTQRYWALSTGYMFPVGLDTLDGDLILIPLSGDPEFPWFAKINLETGEFTESWHTSSPPMKEYGSGCAVLSQDGRYLVFPTSRVDSELNLEFRLSVYDIIEKPAILKSYSLPLPPSHISGCPVASSDNRDFYFLLVPGSRWEDPETSHGLWRFDAVREEFSKVSEFEFPDLRPLSIDLSGKWLLMQKEIGGQLFYLHLPTGVLYPFNLGEDQAAVIVPNK